MRRPYASFGPFELIWRGYLEDDLNDGMRGTPVTTDVRTDQDRRPPAALSWTELLALATKVAAPVLAGGVIVRRRAMMALAEKLQVDRAAVRTMERLRGRYRSAPLVANILGRSLAVVLSPEDVGRVLAGSPEPFTPATREKRAALEHFQPHGLLISSTADRPERRRFNEKVLQTPRPIHDLARPFAQVLTKEIDDLLEKCAVNGELEWDTFADSWWRAVRRMVLGDSARNDETLIEMLAKLRASANWAFMGRDRGQLKERFLTRLDDYLRIAEPGSLAALIADSQETAEVPARDQVAHWLFAFDAAGIVTLRALMLLATHGEQAVQAQAEADTVESSRIHQLRYLRACFLESVRLWPTTPALLRDSTVRTEWGSGSIAGGTMFLIFTPFFHRDPRLAYADRFAPEIWLDGRAQENPALVPFSAGPAQCPGQNLVLYVASTLLGIALNKANFRVTSTLRPRSDKPLPATVNHFGLRFRVSAR